MKKRSFLAGMLTMALIVGLGMSALAATGSFTITVDPVNIQVNGTTFAPKDAKGNDVPVFAYGGTTYAPLRALAEAYGLTVGYDGTANMATVSSAALPSQPPVTTTPPADYSDWSKEDEAAYQEFKGLWKFESESPAAGEGVRLYFSYTGEHTELEQWADDHAPAQRYFERFAVERYSGSGNLLMVFWYRGDDVFSRVFIDSDGSISR